ncbi:MAG: phosphotransferase [Nocardioides sp.]
MTSVLFFIEEDRQSGGLCRSDWHGWMGHDADIPPGSAHNVRVGSTPQVAGYRDVRPATGGNSGEVFLACSEETGEEVVLRVFGAGHRARGPEAPGVQAAVLRLIDPAIPAPRLVELRECEDSAVLVTTCLPGSILDDVLTERPDLSENLGTSLGAALARLGNIGMRGPGDFLDATLKRRVWQEGAESLVTWWDRWCHRGPILQLPQAQRATLRELCAYADELLASSPRACLVHGDLSLRNILCDPESGEITGLFDWEFAHSGHPLEDVGHALRERPDSAFTDAMLTALNQALPAAEQADVATLRERARAADLFWLIEIGSRLGEGSATTTCHRVLREIAAARALVPPH